MGWTGRIGWMGTMFFPSRLFRLTCLSCLFFLAACSRAPQSQIRVVTFNRDIAPILYSNCATCHRPIEGLRADSGDPICFAGAPFSVLEYRDVSRHAKEIASATASRRMPPWLPTEGHGDFAGARRLRDDQIALLQQWAEQGAPEGDPAAKPALPELPRGWQLGQPDLVVQAPRAFTVPAGGGDLFRNFSIAVPIAATRYVRAVELRADNPRMLHHASIGVDRLRVSRKLDGHDGQPGFAAMPDDEVQNVFGWSPGKAPHMEPADRAWTLDKGSDLVVQMHLLPTGKPDPVQPVLGLFLSDTPPAHEPLLIRLESKSIDIPAGDSNYIVEDTYTLPAGTRLSMRFTYDNSKGKSRVKWGPKSSDEMGALWIEVQPRRREDIAVLMRDYYERSVAADIAGAEMQVRTSPRDPLAHNLLATKYLQARRVDDAVAQLGEALRLNPRDAEAHSNLAQALQTQGKLPDAVREARLAASLKPSDDRVHFNLASALNAAGASTEAIDEFAR